MGGGRESVCLGLRSPVDSLALNKALNTNINFFFQCACVWSYLLLLPYGSQLPFLKTYFIYQFLKNYKEVYALNYENVISRP